MAQVLSYESWYKENRFCYELRKNNIYKLEYLMTEREGIDINMNINGSTEQIANKSNK